MKGSLKTKKNTYVKKIKEILEELLGYEKGSQDLDGSFLELGINSVLAVELVETLNSKLKIDLGIEVVFDYRNVYELAEHILEQVEGKAPAKSDSKQKTKVKGNKKSDRPKSKPISSLDKSSVHTSVHDFRHIELKVKEVLSKLLENTVSSNDLERSFLELGINSVLAVELVEALNEELGIDLGIEVVFDYRDVKELAKYISGEFFTKKTLEQLPINIEEISVCDEVNLTALSKEEIELKIKEVMSLLLKNDGELLDLDKSFVELGLTSELIEGVNEKLGIDLGIEKVFDYKGTSELAEFIFIHYGNGFSMDLPEGSSDEYESAEHENLIGEADQDDSLFRDIGWEGRNVEIAIIGISGKFAESETIEEFWKHLQAGDDCIKEINRSGWLENEFYDPDSTKKNKSISKWGGLLRNIERFEPLFFNISPLEAERMDPQQRLFLEEAYKAFEDGGYSPKELSGKKVGVFVGGRASDYRDKTLMEEEISTQTFLGSDMAILSARISYFLNLKGPSLSVDTACSSSLVAIHLASESIRRGESDIALAGGVFVLSSPEFYVMTSKTAMLSPDGKCKTFDNDANGIVLGEGVGAVLLKRLDAAIEDGDHIYGVIKGSAINQDGKTKGITAPSMLSQKALLHEAYEKASINPETIGYIEAHGTGTKLGDPIEVKALTEAFSMFTDKKRFCAIGSHKPNFGHSIMSAGIGGVFKILMAMKYGQIPPTINVKEVNRHIDFERSPFFINTELMEWKRKDGIPRRAGVSSFGFSGTNCHVIIEEPPLQKNTETEPAKPFYLFPLSAMTKEALDQKLEDMALWIEREGENFPIQDISYTLFKGRSHFSQRCIFIAKDLSQLKQKIQEVKEKGLADGYFTSEDEKLHAKKDSQEEYGIRLLEDISETGTISRDVFKEKLESLAKIYINGYDLDWEVMFEKGKYHRVPLPTYPFMGENYWVPGAWKHDCYEYTTSPEYLHPLLQVNTSNLLEQRFTSTFTGKEFFLEDHVVRGRKIMPGVACLEMARAAAQMAASPININHVRLKNIVWARPITVADKPVQVNIRLYPEEGEEISYVIFSEHEEENKDDVIYGQGSVVFGIDDEVPSVDLEVLKSGFSRGTLTREQCYKAYSIMGIDYGPGHKGVEEIRLGEDKVLARLSLPDSVSNTHGQFVLHPSIIDSALQASLGLRMKDMDKLPKLALPFALQEIEITDKCAPDMWALISYSEGSKAGDKVEKLDVDLIDDTGKICVRLKGFSTRVLDIDGDMVEEPDKHGTVIMEPYWKELSSVGQNTSIQYMRNIVMLLEPDENSVMSIRDGIGEGHCIVLKSTQEDIGERFKTYATQIFEEIRNTIIEKPEGKILIQVVHLGEGDGRVYSGLSGLLKTARIESSKIVGQLIEIESWNEPAKVIEILKSCSFCPQDIHLKYLKGKMLSAGWREVDRLEEVESIAWKSDGVYLITGGAGKLGLIFAKEIAEKADGVTLILTGRSSLNEDKQEKIEEIKALGARIKYKRVDMTDKREVFDLIKGIKEEFGRLNGIIHGAGFIKDSLIHNKTVREYQDVLAPKVLGLVNTDLASKELELDFMILFSSVAGALGNLGQADYSAANSFMDAFAEYRSSLTASGQRSGKTLSVNWPLWKDGGMHVDKESESILRNRMGMVPMETSAGLRSFYRILSYTSHNLMAVEGNINEIREKLIVTSSDVSAEKIEKVHEEAYHVIDVDLGSLQEKVEAALKLNVSRKLKIKLENIDSNSELSRYGFDSITLLELANQLNEEFKITLAPTIFFEHTTIKKVAKHLIDEYKSQMAARFDVQPKEKAVVNTNETVGEEFSPVQRKIPRFTRFFAPMRKSTEESTYEPIAIVGISGAFPQSEDANQLWQNIIEGRNCITEIPDSRWNWREYYGDPMNQHNKTKIKWGGFIEGVDQFDPLFFEISPREAELMDPQQRLLLTHVWKAIEDAGIAHSKLAEQPTGVFVSAVGLNEYLDIQTLPKDNPMTMTSIVPSMVPNRISYTLNLSGPSEYFETACSSVFVSLHRAVQSLHHGECKYAIVGSVNLLLSPLGFAAFEAMGFLSHDGQTRPFQANANGYVRSEGVGVLVLKLLKDAVEDKDHIYAVIKGTGVAHGGKGMSMTAPSAAGIKAAMLQAYRASNIDPRTVSYIESHGIGSPLGDGIEINALKSGYQELSTQYQKSKQDEPVCYIGNINPSIGHGEVVSGMAALMKVIFAIRHKIMPGIPNFTKPHENIILKGSPYQILKENRKWEALKDESGRIMPRRASISSYGFGGVNAHIVVEEYISPSKESAHRALEVGPQIMVFSAKNQERVREVINQMLEYVQLREELRLEDIAYTLQVGREVMDSRVAMMVNNREEFMHGMREYLKAVEENRDIEAQVTIYTGNLNEDQSEIRSLLSGKLEEVLLDVLLGESNLEKLALYWVKGGNIPWKSLHKGYEPQRISLPTYPFEKKSYWIHSAKQQQVSINEELPAGSYGAKEKYSGSLSSQIRDRIGGLIGIPPEDLPAKKPLNSLGFSSMQSVTLKFLLEQDFGTEIPISTLSEQNTIEQMEKSLAELVDNTAFDARTDNTSKDDLNSGNTLTKILPDTAGRYEVFPINDIQESFLTGRKLRFGGDWTGCHIYFEIERDNLDIYRLNKAWERLVERHDMLRAVILPNGNQKVLEKTPVYRFKTADLRWKNQIEIKEYIQKVREKMSHKVYESDKWPLYEIRISLCPENKYIIHFSIDELIIDASGIYLLLKEWQMLYENPSLELPSLEISFRDYIIATRKFEKSERYSRDLEYWMKRLENIPDGPKFITGPNKDREFSNNDYYRIRLNGILEKERWSHLKMRAEDLKVSPTAVLLSIFSEFIRIWSGQEEFSLVLTLFNRLPLHPQIDQIIGPFISTNIFTVEKRGERSFEEIISYNQELLWNDLDHSSASGIRVLRELKSKGKTSKDTILPVVFTSLVNSFNNNTDQGREDFFKQISYMVTQTPQVYLDHQVLEQDGVLKFSWDAAEGIIGKEKLREMFSAYCQFLDLVSSKTEQWDIAAIAKGITSSSPEQKPLLKALQGNKENYLPEGPMLKISAEDKYNPFPLTDLQQAYIFGRSKLMSGNGGNCQYYQEISAENLDIQRLENAFNKLIKTHEMLTAVLKPEGTQKFLEEVPNYKISVTDLRGRNTVKAKRELEMIKRRMLENVFELERWPYFDLCVSIVDNIESRIHFAIDMLIADGNSIQLLMKQLFYLYEHPDEQLKKPVFSYRDYIISLREYRSTEGYQLSKQYWEDKFSKMPSGPQLPVIDGSEHLVSSGHEQYAGVLEKWGVFKEIANKLSVSPSSILLTAYSEVFSAWLKSEPFSIAVPCWERLELHEDIYQLVGDFTAMSWVANDGKKRTFSEKVKLNDRIIKEDLSHKAVSGLKAIRKAAIKKANGGGLAFPVVFSSLTEETYQGGSGFKKLEPITKTPQVYIDTISEVRGEQLHFFWNVAKGIYPEGMIEELFAGYERLLKSLAEKPENWDVMDFNSLIRPQPEKYGHSGQAIGRVM